MKSLLSMPPADLVRHVRSLGINRFWLRTPPGASSMIASHQSLDDLAKELSASPSYAGHSAVFFDVSSETNALMIAALHKVVRGQGAGGIRFASYGSAGEAAVDGIRLSQGMGRKNALAGLWHGGGKGVIAAPEGLSTTEKHSLLRDYGLFVSSLRGCYVAAEDVGMNTKDMAQVFKTTRFTTCIPSLVGGSGNPSPATARGVVCSMEAALHHLGLGDLKGKSVAVQGVGNVATPMLMLLAERGVSSIVATDVSQGNIKRARAELASVKNKVKLDLRVVPRGDESIFSEPCDILSPCALGAVLNSKTVPAIKAKLIVGAANNQLADEKRDAEALKKRGVTFVPDWVANRMGIVNCANEAYGYLSLDPLNDPSISRHYDQNYEHSIWNATIRALKDAKAKGITPYAAAQAQADKLMEEPHPIFGDRAERIINDLCQRK